MYNPITWSNLSGSGPTPFDLASGTPISGSQILPLTDKIYAGDASGYNGYPSIPPSPYTDTSKIPSIAQINSSYGWNQVIGYYNRRCVLANNAHAYGYNPALVPLPYISPGGGDVHATTIASIYTSIAALRAYEGLSVYAFPPTHATAGAVYVGYLVLSYHIAHARRALALEGTQNLIPTSAIWNVSEYESPWDYGPNGEGISSYGFQNIGQFNVTFVNTFWSRALWYFYLPEYTSGYTGNATLTQVTATGAYGGAPTAVEVFDGTVVSAPATVVKTSGTLDWTSNNPATGGAMIGSTSSLPSTITATVGGISNPGQWRFFWVATGDELIGVQPPTTGLNPGTSAGLARPTLTLNWGTF